MDRAAQVLHHPAVYRIGAAGDGVHQAAPPRHRGKGTDLKARLLQRLQDDVLPVAKLIKYMGKSLQILPGVGDILLEQFLFVFKYCNLGGGPPRVDDQDFHVRYASLSRCLEVYCSIVRNLVLLYVPRIGEEPQIIPPHLFGTVGA